MIEWLTNAGLATWGVVLLVLGLWLAIPHCTRRSRIAGALAVIVAIMLLLASLPIVEQRWFDTVVFWLLAIVTVGGSATAISMRSPVYAAIWFAASLLGTAGLLVNQQAQFLGVATVVVYAGAIVVTFLFVVMLAQPEGHESHDRLTWGRLAKPASVVSGGMLIGLLLTALASLPGNHPPHLLATPRNLDNPHHLARLGNELFAVHLVSVELAGTLLLVALVGAIAIMIHGKERRSASEQGGQAAGRNVHG